MPRKRLSRWHLIDGQVPDFGSLVADKRLDWRATLVAGIESGDGAVQNGPGSETTDETGVSPEDESFR